MRVGLSTTFVGLLDGGEAGGWRPEAAVDYAERSGVSGLLLDAHLDAERFERLASLLLARRDRLPVWGVEGPCPMSRAAAAELASLERDEVAAAVAVAATTIERAGQLGAGVVLLRLGEVRSLRRDWPLARRAFRRGALAEDRRPLERLLAARALAVPRHLDGARRVLDRLSRRAESAGVVLGLRNPPRLLGLPTPDELRLLLDDLRGAPIAPALDLAAAHLDEAMGVRTVAAVVAAWRTSPLALIADACGPVRGLVPGQGEIDLPAALGALGEARLVFHPSSTLTVDEVRVGLAALQAR